MTRAQVAVISDDLTGALDASAPFAVLGWHVVVATSPEHLRQALAAGPDVVAVSLGSREVSAGEAAARADAVARQMTDIPRIFKKIDSRLKGNVRAEVVAVAEALKLRRVLVCPAIPDLGRIVRQGAIEGVGVTAPIPVAAALRGVAVECPDAVSESDLDALVANFGSGLLVGARGLAAALARQMGRKARVQSAQAVLSGPVVIVVGSRDPITLAQVRQVQSRRGAALIAAPDGAVPKGKSVSEELILQAVEGRGAEAGAVAVRLARGLCDGYLAGRRGLVLTGGETAAAVLAEMGVGVLDLLGEVQPGLPLCRPLDMGDAPLIVTKSGGFGDADCLVRLLDAATVAGVGAG